MYVHNILHMHRLIEVYIFEESAFQDTSILSHLEEVSRINKTKRLSLFATSVLQVSLQTSTPQSVCVCSRFIYECVCVFMYTWR